MTTAATGGSARRAAYAVAHVGAAYTDEDVASGLCGNAGVQVGKEVSELGCELFLATPRSTCVQSDRT